MALKKLGGQPLIDRKESMERFNEVVEPILNKKGFQRIKKNGHTMVNDSTKTIIISKSCPSDVKHVRETKQLTNELKKQYEGYTMYMFFHRNKEEWMTKEVYVSVLQSIMKNKKLKGIVCGLDALSSSFTDILSGKLLYKI